MLRLLGLRAAAAAAAPPGAPHARGAATLALEELTAGGAAPLRTAYLLHGLLGQGRNWRSFGKRLLDAAAAAGAPDWRLLLVDLRHHGQTHVQGRFTPEGPHTLAAAAGDVAHLAAAVGAPQLLLGHSMGGKVALAYAATAPPPLAVWALDSVPSAAHPDADPHAVQAVLDAVAALPAEISSRPALLEALNGKVPPATAAWLASSLVPTTPGIVGAAAGPLRLGFDLRGARALYASYKDSDLWHIFEAPPPGVDVHLVRAGRSGAWGGAVAARVAQLPPAAAARLHLLPDASHWLHIDRPDELVQLLLPAFTRAAPPPPK